MREIGRTETGGHIVELTRAEYDSLVSLAEVLAGSPYIAFGRTGMRMMDGDKDADEAFKAIRAWVVGKSYTLEMRRYLDLIDAAFDPEKGKSKIIKAVAL